MPDVVRRGRPPAFNRAAAIDRAMVLFWERGYEGTSYAALTAALEISSSSLQNAFGSKEQLFQEAVSHYLNDSVEWISDALDVGTDAFAAFEAMLQAAAVAFAADDHPRGCLVSLAATQISPDLESVGRFAAEARGQVDRTLANRIRRGIHEGDLPVDTDADVLGIYFATVLRGMAIQARDGGSVKTLQAVGRLAMKCWPRR
ncbi:TetR/AcrR family transcriptional regulator [Streptomyces sp. NBC_00038]|uniref:TetR/AcrR family transcriptional regulator n=1 Tax=Streptomyces sp. NBC_00038 TaxID=2903615 RepID=UPI002253910D|nr:TetR/AcrR family transcriptional regulator [Streptomyces sp. NBC_00038]MCX5554576.1 TetR/AcrR family transcriptional regulator [Streptomyces sp. NBC_00038]